MMERDHFVQGVLTVEDKAYILDPDLRLANGELIHLLYSDLRDILAIIAKREPEPGE